MIYLTHAMFKTDYRCFTTGQSFDFKSVNLFVGDQGCGKSSLIEAIFRAPKEKKLEIDLTDEAKTIGIDSFYFDFEKHNPRINDPNNYTNSNGTNKGIGFGAALTMRFKSHGETLVDFSINALSIAENSIIFLDEPESSLSVRNQFRLIDECNKAVERGCQLFIATHCYPFIEQAESVLSLEHGKWMPGKEFILLQQKVKQ